MALQMAKAIPKRLKHNVQVIEHVLSAPQKLRNAPSKTIVDVVQPTSNAKQPRSHHFECACVLWRAIHNFAQDRSVILSGKSLAG